jgi:hypothetical protein
MDNMMKSVADYFKPPENYFWRWAENGQIIEWRNGDTICYREELMPVLKHLSTEGLPPLGSILLVLSVCREKTDTPAYKEGILYGTLRLLDYFEKNKEVLIGIKDRIPAAIRLMQLVAALPRELRSGSIRTWLLYVVFQNAPGKIEAANARKLIDAFNTGQFDKHVFGAGSADEVILNFEKDITWLHKALNQFPSEKELELAVRTGIKELPTALELEIPKQDAANLLEQLEQDVRTAGLAQLTHRLIAALNIPMHARGSSQQLFGGVSDITNRGNYDRLLLSELAHDDMSLLARLANNEALYLRREELPSNREKKRVVLIDTTLKMWGVSRVFAVSVALACTRNNKQKVSIRSYVLSGNTFAETDLASKEGIVKTLEQLDAALHCGRALALFMDQQQSKQDDEVFFITEDDVMHNVVFQSILSSLKRSPDFLITVNRNGQLQFYEFIKGRRKLLSEAKFDLDGLLFNVKKRVKKVNTQVNNSIVLTDLPAFMKKASAPLYYPASKIKFKHDRLFEVVTGRLLCITLDQRVLYYYNRNAGARELIPFIEQGDYSFGVNEDADIFILVYNIPGRSPRLYKINPEIDLLEIFNLPALVQGIPNIKFCANKYYIGISDGYFLLDVNTQDVVSIKAEEFQKCIPRPNLYSVMSQVKKIANSGYTVINTVTRVSLNDDGELTVNELHVRVGGYRRKLEFMHAGGNKKKLGGNIRATAVEVNITHEGNHLVRFSRFLWNDGSEALSDSRGFLHLRSSDTSIPEMTIVLIVGKPTACWTSDRAFCGDIYFTGEGTIGKREPIDFYNKYIQRFIDVLKNYAA